MRPIDRRDSNPARELARLVAGAMGALLWVAVVFVGVIAVYGGWG